MTESVEETAEFPSRFSYRTHTQTYSDSLPLSFSTRVAAGKAPVSCREELKYLASIRELGDSFLTDRKVGRGHCSFSESSPHRAR